MNLLLKLLFAQKRLKNAKVIKKEKIYLVQVKLLKELSVLHHQKKQWLKRKKGQLFFGARLK